VRVPLLVSRVDAGRIDRCLDRRSGRNFLIERHRCPERGEVPTDERDSHVLHGKLYNGVRRVEIPRGRVRRGHGGCLSCASRGQRGAPHRRGGGTAVRAHLRDVSTPRRRAASRRALGSRALGLSDQLQLEVDRHFFANEDPTGLERLVPRETERRPVDYRRC
jgi:hypothetical protein